MSAPPLLPDSPLVDVGLEAQPDAQYDQTNMAPVAAAFPSPAAEEDPIQQMLLEKDQEIASLKQAILHQHKEIKRLKKELKNSTSTVTKDLKTASIEGIANDVISPAASAKPGSKIEARWKNRFQQLVAFKLEVCHHLVCLCDNAICSMIRLC